MPVLDVNALIDDRVSAIRRHAQDNGGGKIELDVSGGIDSAVMLCLCVLAVGPDNVTAAFQGISSSPRAKLQALNLMEATGVNPIMADFTAGYHVLIMEMLRALEDAGYDMGPIKERIYDDPTVLGSIRSCLRAPLGRGFNRMTGGGIREGTGNEDEDRWLRFYQKGGDGEVDTNPMAMLSKGEVYQLAVGLGKCMGSGVATALYPIIMVAPEHDLWAGKDSRDETELANWAGAQFTYSTVDPDTGAYTSVGTIERVSRFLDTTPGSWLFSETSPQVGDVVGKSIDRAKDLPMFQGFDPQQVENLLRAARKAHFRTLHKWNPNCPSLGNRQDLLEQGILTDTLPEV